MQGCPAPKVGSCLILASPVTDPIRDDFRNFVYLIWAHLGLPEPTRIQYDIASYLQGGPRRRVIQAFRGIGKSWLTAAYVLWRHYREPNERILVLSANEERAGAFTTFCRRLLEEMPLLAHLQPRRGMRDSVLSFDVQGSMPHQAPSLRAAGITGQITGGRASVIIADDIEVPKNSLTTTMRDRLAELIKEFDAILMSSEDLKHIGLPESEVIYLGTPQTELTVYRTLESRGYQTRIWPSRYPSQKERDRHGHRLAPLLLDDLAKDPTLSEQCSQRGAPTDPHRFNDMDLLEREASYGRTGFAMQFQLDPSLSDMERYPLKLADLVIMDCDPKLAPVQLAWGSSPDLRYPDLPVVGLAGDGLYRPFFVSRDVFAPYQGVKMAIDPAGRGGDELAYAIVGQLHGRLFLLQCRGLKGGYSEDNLQVLAEEAKRFGVNDIVIESNFGDGMFLELLKPVVLRSGHPCHLEEVRSSVQKERRIADTLEPVMNQHRLIVDPRVIREDTNNYNNYPGESEAKYQLFYQMTRLTRDKGALVKDDRLDALAICVAAWVEVVAQDAEVAANAHRQDLLDQEIDKFLNQAGQSRHHQNSLNEYLDLDILQ